MKTKKRKKVVIGLDFDGVVAYNPFRIVRAPIKWFKREVLGIKKLKFFVPQKQWEIILWTVIHESSIVPAKGIGMLKEIAMKDEVEIHLITARFGFLRKNLESWLRRNKLENTFKTVNVNENCEQPHVFKQKMVERLKLDYFVEDNLDIVLHLTNQNKTKVYWIYNLLDRSKNFPNKFPYLGAALNKIKDENTI